MDEIDLLMQGKTNDPGLPLEWLSWRARFQEAMEKAFKKTPSIQDIDFFMLSLVRRLEKETVENFREPMAKCFLKPSLSNLNEASYCAFQSTLDPFSFAKKEIPEHVEAFFDRAEIKEEYRLSQSWYLQKLLGNYEMNVQSCCRAVVSTLDVDSFELFYGDKPEKGSQLVLIYLAVYSLWAQNHAQELEENANLAKVYKYVMERYRNIARQFHYEICERYFTEGSDTKNQVVIDTRIISEDILSRVDYVMKDFLLDVFAKEAGVDYEPSKPKPLRVDIIPNAQVHQRRVEQWEKYRKEIHALIAQYTDLDPSEVNIDRIFCYTFNYLTWFIPETIRMQPHKICASASVVRAEIGKLIQSGYPTIKSSQMLKMIQRQDPFKPPQKVLDACQCPAVLDHMRELCQWACDEIVKGYRQTLQSIANGLLERFDYDEFKKTYKKGKDYADWLALCVINVYRAWFQKYQDVVDSDPLLQEALRNGREFFILLARDYKLPICAYYFKIHTLLPQEGAKVAQKYNKEIAETRQKFGQSLDPIIHDAQILAQEVLLFLDENAKDAFIRNYTTNAPGEPAAPAEPTPADAT